MIELIKEIRSCMENNNLRCALGMALTLPDICAKVEYPNENDSGKQYIKWCGSFLFNQGFFSSQKVCPTDQEVRVISPEACYKLRCAFLHSGNLQLNQRKTDDFPTFNLQITSSKENGVYLGKELRNDTKTIKEITIDIRHLTKVLCNAAEEYFENSEHKEGFKIHHVNIIDLEKETNRILEYRKTLEIIQRSKTNIHDSSELTEYAKDVLDLLQNGQKNKVCDSIKKGDMETFIAIMELFDGGFIRFLPNEELFE